MEVADLGEELFRGATLQSGGERGLSRSESGSGPEASLALEGEGGARRPFAEALEALNPEEEKTFNKHTWWPGLVFKTWRMERVYLDGHARLSKKVVYAGYAGVFVAILILNGLVIYLLFKEQFESQPEAKKYFIGRTLTTLYCLLGTLGVGVLAHFFIHRSTQVSEKSWATLSALVVAMALVSALFVTFISSEAPLPEVAAYPYVFLRYIIVIFPIFLVVGSFGLYVLLCLFSMSLFFGLYPTASRTLEQGCSQDPDCVVSTTLTIRNSLFENSYYALVWIVLTLCGSLVQEIKGRKQFFARVILVEQQEEIIRYKTQNTKLQKDLLNRMLPSTIVQQLEEENFVIQSQKQLENLSQHHSGVCIAFAELEGFATFSSQVHPSSVLNYLDDLFLVFDGLCDDHEVYKVETVGDQYVAAVGVVTGKMHNERVSVNSAALPENECNGELRDVSVFNTDLMISFAKAIMKGSRCVEAPAADVKPVLRIGLHTGPCMSGIVGTKNFRFCLFGDAMNTSARMVQTGPANCIHTTKDVADLTPEEPWEKLKLIDVKGKGSMQTYLLRLEGQADVDAISNSVRSYENPLLQHTDSKRSEQSEESYTFKLLRDNSRVVPGHNKYEDILPVKESIFKAKTTLFGLWFKSLEWEQAYLDGEARMVETEVYIGYLLYILVLLTNVLYGYINYRVLNEICTSELSAYREYCLLKFGRNALDLAVSDPAGRQVTYAELMNFAVIQLSPVSLGVLISLNCVGPILHYWIHRSSYVKKKSWALLTVFVVYTLKLVVIMYMMYDGDVKSSTGENMDAEWPSSWGPMITTQALLLVFFSGVPMKLYLLWWIIACALYFGLTLPILLKEGALLSQGDYSVVITNNEYIKVTLLVFIYAIILNAGKYFKDVSNRKRFLQRVSVLKSQDQIIREKSKNENLQRQFLGNILPPHLVEELEIDKCSPLASIERLRTLTETHMGVSILYADLVGFTWFSAQVDPFKVMVFLNNVFQVFDGLCDEYGVQKVETVGDCYVASVGVLTGELVNFKSPTFSETARALFSLQGSSSFYKSSSIHQSVAHDVTGKFTDHSSLRTTASTNAKSLLDFAKAMILGSRRIKKPTLRTPATMRIGIHAGSCMSGIIGTKNLKYSLVGEDVVTAATMEHEGKPDAIHASDEIAFLLPDEDWKKFKLLKDSYGEDMQTYLLEV